MIDRMRTSMIYMALGLLSALSSGTVSAQEFQNKPVRIVTSESGGGNDLAARLVAQGLTAGLGRQVVVENRGGAGGSIAAEMVAKAAPDGHTLLFYGSAIWLMPYLRDDVPYDPVRDFAPVTLAVQSPNILIVHPSLPVRTVRDLISVAKTRPGALNYGSGQTGSSTHLAAELFKTMAGVDITRIVYKGGGLVINDLISGELQLMFITAGSVARHLKSGKIRAIAITSARPSSLLPDLPTIAATGVPGYEAVSMLGLFVPAKTPPPLVYRLNQEIVRVLARPEIKERFFNTGVETVGSTPGEFAATIKSEMTRMGKVIKDAGIQAH